MNFAGENMCSASHRPPGYETLKHLRNRLLLVVELRDIGKLFAERDLSEDYTVGSTCSDCFKFLDQSCASI